MDLYRKTVKELRILCKEAGTAPKQKRKAELLFTILELPTTCVGCDRVLTSNEMYRYLQNPEKGPNCWVDDEHGAIPCCNSCDNIKPGSCALCGTWWMEYNLRCSFDQKGNAIITCYDCNWCTSCGEQLQSILKENWSADENILCNECCLLE